MKILLTIELHFEVGLLQFHSITHNEWLLSEHYISKKISVNKRLDEKETDQLFQTCEVHPDQLVRVFGTKTSWKNHHLQSHNNTWYHTEKANTYINRRIGYNQSTVHLVSSEI